MTNTIEDITKDRDKALRLVEESYDITVEIVRLKDEIINDLKKEIRALEWTAKRMWLAFRAESGICVISSHDQRYKAVGTSYYEAAITLGMNDDCVQKRISV